MHIHQIMQLCASICATCGIGIILRFFLSYDKRLYPEDAFIGHFAFAWKHLKIPLLLSIAGIFLLLAQGIWG